MSSSSSVVTAGHLAELATIGIFLLACLNARGQGRRWLGTLICGAVVGYCAEVAIVCGDSPSYTYCANCFRLFYFKAPVCIGLGWGLVFYVSTWTAQRLTSRRTVPSLLLSSLVAGVLGVNLDLSLDPVAQLIGLWTWNSKLPGGASSLHQTFFNVPFDNFVAWTLMIGCFGFCTRWLFGQINDCRQPKAEADTETAQKAKMTGLASGDHGPVSHRTDYLVPILGAVLAFVVLVALRKYVIPQLYQYLGSLGASSVAADARGAAILFVVLLFAGLYRFWVGVLTGPKELPVNWVVLGIVVYFHLLSLCLLIAAEPGTAGPLLVVIPTNFVAGFLAFASPSFAPLLTIIERWARRDRAGSATALRPSVEDLTSYTGHRTRATVWKPANEDELRGILAMAREQGLRVTFRGGGQAFDRQSLNRVVISLERFTEIGSVDENAAVPTVTVGSGATWGKILERTLEANCVPYIMVTTSKATAGGTLSSHSLSRFSGAHGREGDHVERIRVILADGRSQDLRSDQPEFLDVVGGLGYVAAIVSVTYRLWKAPWTDGGIWVETSFKHIDGIKRIGGRLRKGLSLEHAKTHRTAWGKVASDLAKELVPQKKDPQEKDLVPREKGGPVARSSTIYMRGAGWGLFASSRYVQQSAGHGRSVFHQPSSWRHYVLQFVAMLPVARGVGYLLVSLVYKKGKTFRDDIMGYTFFQDGNRRVTSFFRYLGCPCRILQQTFMLPSDGYAGFLEEAAVLLNGENIEPNLVDILFVHSSTDATLSSSAGLAGGAYAITYTFQKIFRTLGKEEAMLGRLSELCDGKGGKVHLVKNAFASESILGKQYGPASAALKGRQPPTILRNEFGTEKLPELFGP